MNRKINNNIKNLNSRDVKFQKSVTNLNFIWSLQENIQIYTNLNAIEICAKMVQKLQYILNRGNSQTL